MEKGVILWVDDEMELLLPHVLFLREKGYHVETAVSGTDGLEKIRTERFDLVFLDEEMPGMGGLETLREMRKLQVRLPVVMVTRNEEEPVMDKAIGTGVSDYLIKPVARQQLLLALKKHIHAGELSLSSLTSDYGHAYGKIADRINGNLPEEGWEELYKELTEWSLRLEGIESGLRELLAGQWKDANRQFGRFVKNRYEGWIESKRETPLMSSEIFARKVNPLLERGQRVWLVVIDNLRWDQWCVLRSLLPQTLAVEEEMYWSILPTSTQYSRNAIFSGLLPAEMERRYPDLWVKEDSEEGKNLKEVEFLESWMSRHKQSFSFSYRKIGNREGLIQLLGHMGEKSLNVVVLNFVDMLSHARMENGIVRELACSEEAYREVTGSWFRHSGLLELLMRVTDKGIRVVLTTDHGTIRVDRPLKMICSRETNTNVRYKVGRNLTYDPREVFEVLDPRKVGLPQGAPGTRYVFALGNDFFAYPNDYNRYVSRCRDTYQHGGVSMEEMLLPLVTLGT
ncbi:MAG: PglZ domain-containing protein [Tannerellaceae bacterium]|jgi:CheY-like chemotaxis protein|nr:PglZ domain-containing protein [Tannerellaceae bacterium]